MKISVAMATYNGEKYIKEQIESIVSQLNKDDELVISDDGSTDRTREIIKEFQSNDKRIKLINNDKNGVIKNFENALKQCKNELIFLADQDDVWKSNKVEKIKEIFLSKKDINLVMSDADLVDSQLKKKGKSLYQIRNSNGSIIKNIYKNSYVGCTMAFKKECLDYILPIPNGIAMHDVWIGIMCSCKGKVYLCNDKLMYYRRHDDTATKLKDKKSSMLRIKWRVNLILNILKRAF